jgi:hypothetical protein
MIQSGVKSKQRPRLAWTRDRLLHERALALGHAIDTSTWKNYGSALNSYLTFVRIHNFPVEPTPDTFSFYTVFMCHHIKPDSVDTYLLLRFFTCCSYMFTCRTTHFRLHMLFLLEPHVS